MALTIRPYSPDTLVPWVQFWNTSFSGRRNFFPVTDALLRQRIVEHQTAVEPFDPQNLLFAWNGTELQGFIHVGVRSEEFCKACFSDWKGGAQGFVAFLFVAPDHRRRGTGTALWERGLAAIGRGVAQVVVDGQCLNPFYGNSEAPFTPFFGTPEGVGIPADDEGTRKFFEKKGHSVRFRAVSLECRLAKAPPTDPAGLEHLSSENISLHSLENRMPQLGLPLSEAIVHARDVSFQAVAAIKNDRCVGSITGYRMSEVDPSRCAIYELKVGPEVRGHGIGRFLILTLLNTWKNRGLQTCEVLTVPPLGADALRLYEELNFDPVAEWNIF